MMWINLILNHSRRNEVDDVDPEDQLSCLSTASSPAKGSKSSSNLRGLEDMKQRLRFLRRRHTDSSISSKPSVRPTPEQASKWAESFELLMGSRYGASLFKAFLSREYSQENVEFWMAVEEYKRARPSKYSSKAKKIYEDFIAVKSSKEINVEAGIRSDIKSCLGSPTVTTFDIAQRKIQGLLESDAYLRFLQSNLYRELLIPKVVLPPNAPTSEAPTAMAKLSSSDSAVTIKSATSGESFQSMLVATGGRGKSSPPKSSVSSTSPKDREGTMKSGSSSSASDSHSYSSRSNSASSASSCHSPSMASSEEDDQQSEEAKRRLSSHSSRENEESVL